eukprot:1141113-Pelagomonas_calceolata.AAC.7
MIKVGQPPIVLERLETGRSASCPPLLSPSLCGPILNSSVSSFYQGVSPGPTWPRLGELAIHP